MSHGNASILHRHGTPKARGDSHEVAHEIAFLAQRGELLGSNILCTHITKDIHFKIELVQLLLIVRTI